MFTASVPNWLPFLPLSLPLLALQGSPSLPSARAALGLLSGTNCRHSASAGKEQEEKK